MARLYEAGRVNDRMVPAQPQDGHLVIAADLLRNGENTIGVAFTAGNEGALHGMPYA